MKWEKQVPNKAGWWLRVNAGHRVQLHRVFGDFRSLEIIWGWSGKQGPCKIKDIEEKLKYFFWCGPLPEPPAEAL